MKAIIIEDESSASQFLLEQLSQIAADIEVVAILTSIEESVDWINSYPLPDLAFVDIHLADGCSFSIFEECNFNCPIIFTTAYDQYAIKAFEVNSIGYILKPIDKKALRIAIDKISSHSYKNNTEIIEQVFATILSKKTTYKQNILISNQDKLIPLSVNKILFFYIDNRQVIGYTSSLKSHRINFTLDELQDQLNPLYFFRVNRQFIIQHSAVKDITQWFGGKYIVNLLVEVPEKIVIPKAKVALLKEWLSNSGE